jgi:hypothetical protein
MSRIEKEKQTVEQMIRLYCRKKEGNGTLCPQCRELLEYAQTRLSRCPFGDGKSTCRICTGNEGTDESSDEMGRTENVALSSGGGYPTFVAGIY